MIKLDITFQMLQSKIFILFVCDLIALFDWNNEFKLSHLMHFLIYEY